MKKMMLATFAMCLVFALRAVAGGGDTVKMTGIVTDPMCGKSGDKAKMTNADCVKKCASNGKLAFVSTSDGTLWSIDNSDAVKGHEGHEVQVDAHVNKEQGSMHVTNVSMAGGGSDKTDKMQKNEAKKEDKKPTM
jgi:hypothetical protein